MDELLTICYAQVRNSYEKFPWSCLCNKGVSRSICLTDSRCERDLLMGMVALVPITTKTLLTGFPPRVRDKTNPDDWIDWA